MWITEPVDGVGMARPTPIGYIPANNTLDIAGTDASLQDTQELLLIEYRWLADGGS